METVWWSLLILVFGRFVVCQPTSNCGKPTPYEDKLLDAKYRNIPTFKNGSRVAYICSPGYVQTDGLRLSFCTEGQWTALSMTCQKKPCGALEDIENGRYIQEGRLFGDKATAVCDEGYILTGASVRVCQDHGWTGINPSCEVDPHPDSEAAITCSAPSVANRQIETGESSLYKPTDTVTIICREGFGLIGSPQITCGPDGQWQNLPECHPKVSKGGKCSVPKLGKGTVKDPKPVYELGDSLSVVCNKGFTLNGSVSVFTCGVNKKWLPYNPKCQFMKCPHIKISNGEATLPKVSTAKITCAVGFKLHGAKQLHCVNGVWTPAVPTCEPVVTCSAPIVANGEIQNGKTTPYKPKDSLTIVCKEGFDLIGSPQITCGLDGQWHILPQCRSKDISNTSKCGPGPSHPLARPRSEQKEYTSDSILYYKCIEGHRWARGTQKIICNNGQWTPLQIQCIPKSCGSAGEISNGRFEYSGVSFGDTARAVCHEGFELIGSAIRVCRDSGWDRRIPVCEPVHCPPPPVVPDAEMFDTTDEYVPFGYTASYRCRTGTLIGASEIHCTKHGTWSERPPQCKEVVCPYPRVLHGSRIFGFRSVYKFGHIVTFTCNPSFRLRGSNSVACGIDGKWRPELPECV